MTPGISGLRGLWRRSMIAWPDGTRDLGSSVRWLQGLSACIDLRQPAALDAVSAPAAHDLSFEQCMRLAQQQGFAGRCAFDGSHFVWSRSIDFQPQSPAADAGSLHWEGNVLVETGRDVAYVEHWHRDSIAATLPVAAAVLRDADNGTAATLLRVGPVFMFARDRALPLAGRATLGECVAAATTLQQAQQLVDCEISFGDALPTQFRISASTLPWRIGAVLDQCLTRAHLTTLDCAPDGAAITRRWQIIDVEGEQQALAVAGLASACGN